MDDCLEVAISQSVVVSYDGDTNEESGLYDGYGEATFSNGGSYEGEFHLGMFHGKGKYIWKDTSVFEGDFDSGLISGKGVFTWANGSKYEGEVKNGKRQGTGQYTSADGQQYSGEWLDGLRHGKGKMYYGAEKSVLYVGTWVRGLRDGYGTMRYASGNTYEGEWSLDKKCGRGVMVWKDVDEMYLGQWAEDQPDGYGEYIWADSAAKPSLKRYMCNMYRGLWSSGRRSGVGTFFYSDGSQYTGEWADNQKDGSGVYCHADGTLHFGFYAQDRMLLDDALPKETDAVTPQVKIHIEDVLSTVCPGDDEYAIGATKTIERLILRYNSTIRAVCKRYADFANAKRKHLTDLPPEDWSRLDKLTYTTRNIHKRLLTSTLGDFWRFCREFSITGPHFTAFDVCSCLADMQVNRRCVARDLQREQERSSARRALEAEVALLAPPPVVHKVSKPAKGKPSKTTAVKPTKKTETVVVATPQPGPAAAVKSVIPLKALTPAYIEDLIVPSIAVSATALQYDPRYPLREYEFVELFVRCAVRSHLNEQLSRAVPDTVDETVDVIDNNGRMSTVGKTQLGTMGNTQALGGTMNKLRTGTVKSSNGTDVADIVYSALAEKLHAVTNDWTQIPSLAGDLYSTGVQQMLAKQSAVLGQMYANLCGGAAAPTFRDVIVYLLSLKSPTEDFAKPVLAADCSLLKLLGVICDTLVDEDPSILLLNMTKLDSCLLLDDFTELLCKLVLSEVWIYGDAATSEPAPADGEPTDVAEVDALALTASDIKIVTPSQTIAEKLSVWFDDYRKPPPEEPAAADGSEPPIEQPAAA